jgi:hypothetical protein
VVFFQVPGFPNPTSKNMFRLVNGYKLQVTGQL